MTAPPSSNAFRSLVEAYFDELCHFVYRYVQSVDEAKDLVYDTLLQLWQQRRQVDLTGDIRSHLYTIARYRALAYLRHHRVEEQWRRRYFDPAVIGEGVVFPIDPEQELAGSELGTALRQAVDALPPRQRRVLMLRWQRRASCDEIALALAISPKTVAIYVSRAIQHLRETLPGTLNSYP